MCVQIVDPTRYAQGAAEALNGARGTLVKQGRNGEWNVEFDDPAPTWWTHQSPVKSFWMPESDLTAA